MTQARKSIVVERVVAHAPIKVWRALTQSALIEQWLMKNDFEPNVGRQFTFRSTPVPGWSGVTNCVVLEVQPPRRLVYSWGDGTESDTGLKTIVSWTLTPEGDGTRVRMEHSGFGPQDENGFTAMSGGWPRIVEGLGRVTGELPAI